MIRAKGTRIWIGLLLLGTALQAVAADLEIKAGGGTLILPAPASDFVEAGDKLRTMYFELLAPTTNRLLSAYLPARTLADSGGKLLPRLDQYALVEVVRQVEYSDFTPQAFEQVAKSIEPSIANLDDKKMAEFQQEMSIRLNSLGSKPIAMDRPEMLGALFKKTDTAGFAMLMSMKQSDRTITMAGGMALLRVRQRMVFAYLFRRYESPDTIAWIHTTLESWCDEILAKNN